MKTLTEAADIARTQIGSLTSLSPCPEHLTPKTLYNFDAPNYYVFTVEPTDQLWVGGSWYVAVHKIDGSFIDLGSHGE
jgi:hypothetical protein